jgi:hypothetical protein
MSNAQISTPTNTVSKTNKFPTCDECLHNTVHMFNTVI